MTTRSTPASTNFWTRTRSFGRVWIDAPHSNRFLLSFEARGKSRFLRKSLREMAATNSKLSLTTGSLPFLLSRKIWLASSSVHPDLATVRSVVMTCETSVSRSRTKSWSRVVMIPRSFAPSLPPSVTGQPEKPCICLIRSSSESFVSGETVNGSRIKPFSKRLTRRTSSHCSSMVLLQWIMPSPPKRAIWTAIWCSVTVSMGLEMNGILIRIRFVAFVASCTSTASKSMLPGRMM
mmetsp:Transcript_6703/g.15034  ORF Transcript_6703/g.15034 Transcript_6703/m.15034 type:complete len:235 (+) Transcript_6703:1576-2280(+)